MNRIRISIIEDDLQTRQMLQTLIESKADMYECDGAYGNAQNAIDAIKESIPDVVLVDIHLPGGITGIECVRELKIYCPDTEFIMCTSLDDANNIFDALKAGATGYITKASVPNELLDAIKVALNGGAPMSGHVARKVLGHFYNPDIQKRNAEKEKLSSREQEILAYLAQGMRYKEIAGTLQVSVETVRKHIHNIYDKLQVSSRTDALNKVYYST